MSDDDRLPATAAALQLVAPMDVGGVLQVVIGCAHEAGDVVSIPMGILADGRILLGRRASIMGWAVVENTGTARAQVNIIDGLDTTGTIIAPITLAAGESTRDYLPGQGVHAKVGVYAHVVSGQVTGAVWVRVPGETAEG